MENYMVVAILFGLLFTLILLGVPVAFAAGLAAFIACFTCLPTVPAMVVVQRMFAGLNSFSTMCIPFFLLAGEFMTAGKIIPTLVRLSDLLVGRIRGGLAHINIVASLLFGGVSGAATADASSLGAFLIPVMEESGYDTDFSVAVTATSAPLGLIIPPSNIMIIYAMTVQNLSIAALFMGGIIPGVLIGIALMLVAYWYAVKRGYRKEAKIPGREIPKILLEGILPMLTFVIIVGGILGGIFTATEAAMVAAVYSFILAVVIYRSVSLKDVPKLILNAAKGTVVILFLIGTSYVFGWLIGYCRVPELVSNFMMTLTGGQGWLIKLFIVLLLFVLGFIMEGASIVIIFTPIFLPIMQSFGMSVIQFGIIMAMAVAIGNYTPPIGPVLYITAKIGHITPLKAFKACVPFMIASLIIFFLVMYIPALSTWLPSLLIK